MTREREREGVRQGAVERGRKFVIMAERKHKINSSVSGQCPLVLLVK
jgi:hypothetical protein